MNFLSCLPLFFFVFLTFCMSQLWLDMLFLFSAGVEGYSCRITLWYRIIHYCSSEYFTVLLSSVALFNNLRCSLIPTLNPTITQQAALLHHCQLQWVNLPNSPEDSSLLSQACREPLSHKENYISPDWGDKMAAHVTVHTGYTACKPLLIFHCCPLQWKCIKYREKGMWMANKRHNLIHLSVTCDQCCFIL